MSEEKWNTRRAQFATFACAVAIVVGSLGPWVTLFGITFITGIHGDGAITIALGALAGLGTLVRIWRSETRRWLDLAVVLLLGLACAIAVYDWTNMQIVVNGDANYFQVGWGLHLVAISSTIGLALSTVAAVRGRRRGTIDTETVEQALVPGVDTVDLNINPILE